VEKRVSVQGSDKGSIALNATHSDMVKFRGRDDPNYVIFIGQFKELVATAIGDGISKLKWKSYDMAAGKYQGFLFWTDLCSVARTKAFSFLIICFLVPQLEYIPADFSITYELPREPRTIVPRNQMIAKLTKLLHPTQNSEVLHFGIATLYGLPGTGKTTLARHYAELHKDDLSFVFWVGAESRDTVTASYLELANTIAMHYSKYKDREVVENDLGLEGVQDMLKVKSIQELDPLRVKSVVKAVKDWLLRRENDKWLLVFDNVEPSYDIFEFIPLTMAGQVILTARDDSCCSWGTKLSVDAMTETEALQILEVVVGAEAMSNPAQCKYI
jgi:hypothetical protein